MNDYTGMPKSLNIKHPQALAFAKAMEEVLCENDYKGGWQDGSINMKCQAIYNPLKLLLRGIMQCWI